MITFDGYIILYCRFPSFSTLLFSASLFWSEEFLLRNQLITLWSFHCMVFPSCCHEHRVFIFNFCHFYYNMSRCGALWVHLIWSSLCFLDLVVCFLPHIRKVFIHYVFKCTFYPFLSRSSLPGIPIM